MPRRNDRIPSERGRAWRRPLLRTQHECLQGQRSRRRGTAPKQPAVKASVPVPMTEPLAWRTAPQRRFALCCKVFHPSAGSGPVAFAACFIGFRSFVRPSVCCHHTGDDGLPVTVRRSLFSQKSHSRHGGLDPGPRLEWLFFYHDKRVLRPQPMVTLTWAVSPSASTGRTFPAIA